MLRKLLPRKPKETPCPAFALGCDNCTPISILKPEIVIEERRWIPYPLVIRHYIPKPKPKKFHCLRELYCKCVEEWRNWEQRRQDKKRAKETEERIERERCLRELRRLHSYHQKLCCDTRSFKGFSKHVKKVPKSKSDISCLPKTPTIKEKCMSQKGAKACPPPDNYICCRIMGRFGCVLTLLSLIALTLFVLI